MIGFLGHPSFERLSRYADAELTGKARERVASHLAGCTRCRDTIRFIRDLGEVARNLPAPEPPADALPRLLARRAAGERVILPTADPVPIEAEQKRALPAIAATIVLFMAGALLFSVPRLGADRSRLEFSPERPRAGATVQVRYAAGSLLDSEPTLVLRGRLRFADGSHRVTEVATLTRGADGVFHGVVSLPDSVVYGAFAVEDSDASRVDSNNSRLWELLVHGEDGKPLYEALRERTNDLFIRNWELAHETARTAERLYPDRAWSGYTLFRFESALAQGAARDSVVRHHRERLRELDRHWAQQGPTEDDAAFLAMYAMALGEREIHERWRSFLLQHAPGHRTSLQFRLFDLQRDTEGDSLLENLERLGAEAGFGHRELVVAGLFEAIRVRDTSAAMRWANRYLEIAPEDAGMIAHALAEAIAPNAELYAWLREVGIKAVNGDLPLEREPHETATEHRRKLADLGASVQHVIARTCLRAGDSECALEHLGSAAAIAWNPVVFDAFAHVLADRGRTEEAAQFLARVAIDPLADSANAANADALGRSWVGDHRWQDALDRAHSALAAHVAPYAVYRRIPSDLELLDSDGDRVSTGAALTGTISVVAFWSPQSAPAIEALPEIERAAHVLQRESIRTIAVQLDRASTEAEDRWKAMMPSVEQYFDPRRELAAAVDQWGTPEYFVVDQAGIVRFRYPVLQTAILQAKSLTGSERNHLIAP